MIDTARESARLRTPSSLHREKSPRLMQNDFVDLK
jgi:hypothetical protein